MCVSNEPGFYKDGEFGIRIENVIMVNNHPKFSDRLHFENLTFCPYSKELIDLSLLSEFDRAYLDQFNKRVSISQITFYSVWNSLLPFLRVMSWLSAT
jgi:Xaa-Pro aminopeptidase